MTRFFFFILILMISSCQPGKVYEKHIDTKNLLWNRFDIKKFDVEIRDVSENYDFIIAIRHHTDMPYPYLDVYFTFYTPSGEMRTSNHRIRVRDENGKLLGDGLGELWDLHFTARKGFQFSEPGICSFEISSAMSQADLAGILQVGLIVKKSKKT